MALSLPGGGGSGGGGSTPPITITITPGEDGETVQYGVYEPLTATAKAADGGSVSITYYDEADPKDPTVVSNTDQLSVGTHPIEVLAQEESLGVAEDTTFTVHVEPDTVCYLAGTRILTPTGEMLVESLKRGDPVVTRFGGIQKIKWIGRQSYRGAAVRDDRERIPVHLRPGSLGEGLPARDLYVSPGHSMLIEGSLVLATSLVNGVTITQNECPERIDYFQIELEGHDCVIAEGTWSETFADWEEGRQCFHNAAEFHALFPEHHAPETPILCAPRPERGAALETVLRPIVARASRDRIPGSLNGYIDCVRGDWKLDGWAHDAEHPELPVLLEILIENRVIGTVLACDYRPDLLKAGFGQGRCSFTFISPIKLRPALLATLQVRRVVDGASVTISETILGAAAEPAIVKPRLSIVA